MKRSWLIAFVVLIALVSCASAETITGELTAPEGWLSYNMNTSGAFGGTVYYGGGGSLQIYNPEYTVNSRSLVHFDRTGYISSYSVGAPAYAYGPMTLTKGTDVVATGTIGYSRYFTGTPPTEQPGYQYFIFDTWNISALTPSTTETVIINFNQTAVPLVSSPNSVGYFEGTPDGGYVSFGPVTHPAIGITTYNKEELFANTYDATKPSGIGIQGNVTKHGSSDQTQYSSRVYIINGITGQGITSESTTSTSTFHFNVLADSIIIALKSSGGTWYNTSPLFAATPTITPTTTTTPITPSNPIPAGYVRSEAQCVNGQTSGTIQSCTIYLKDVEAGTWSNITYEGMGSYYGTSWIDTLPNHTIDAYGSATGFGSVSRLGLPASSSKMYELVMWPSDVPPAGSGYVNLFVIISDAQSGNSITGAQVTVRDSTGITQAKTTGTSGTVQFQVTNSSLSYITAFRSGYSPASDTITTSASGSDTKRIELLKEVVTATPTNTIPPGGVTTAITQDPAGPPGSAGYTNAKGQQMMDFLAQNGLDLVALCFMVTVLALLGVRLGK